MQNQNNGAENNDNNSSSSASKNAATGALGHENIKQHEGEESQIIPQHQLSHQLQAPHAARAAQPELSSSIENNESIESIEIIESSRNSSATNCFAPALNPASVSAAAESEDTGSQQQQQHLIHPKAHTHRLVVRQQPLHSRMCGFGDKVDRRPVDPPPVIQLEITSAGTPQDISYLYNPYYFMYASLVSTDNENEIHILHDGKTRSTTGSIVSSLYRLKDLDNKDGAFFVFPDLSVRMDGSYRLKETELKYGIVSNVFNVYSAKKFPGMEESTFLSKAFAEQGLKIRIRKELRVRSRTAKSQQSNGNELPSDKKRSSLDSDDEEQSDGLSNSTDHVNKKTKNDRNSSDGATNPTNGSSSSFQNENETQRHEFSCKQPEVGHQPPQQRHTNSFSNPQSAHHQYSTTHNSPSNYNPPPPQQYQQYSRPIGGPHPYTPVRDVSQLRPSPPDDSYWRRYSGEYNQHSPAPHRYPVGPGYGGYHYG
ncbi:hypothetical protein HK100_001759, partial [Physocladia obscura]